MNKRILDSDTQLYISTHLNDDVHKIAMTKSPVSGVSAKELANQITSRKKSAKKLPTWFNASGIYFPAPLSIEQTSSEITAKYKAELVSGDTLIDLTGGFGVDGYYFSQKVIKSVHCEINEELLKITAHNADVLKQYNTTFVPGDGLEYMRSTNETYGTIYLDPARRGNIGKVFMLKDCEPNVIEHLDLLMSRSNRVIIKTAPLLDITAGINELGPVSEIHIVSTRNECKELLWILTKSHSGPTQIKAVTLNEQLKTFSFNYGDDQPQQLLRGKPMDYLYEPDAALLKSGAFNIIGNTYGLRKLDSQTQLFVSDKINQEFPGRIFKINRIISPGELKKEKNLSGNVIVRNYRDKAEHLVNKFKIKSDRDRFLLFTYSKDDGFIVIDGNIIQHY